MHAKLQPRATPRAALMVSVLLSAATGAIRPASADQDDDAERVPSSAADIYSPIQRTFEHQCRCRAVRAAACPARRCLPTTGRC